MASDEQQVCGAVKAMPGMNPNSTAVYCLAVLQQTCKPLCVLKTNHSLMSVSAGDDGMLHALTQAAQFCAR